MPRWLLLAATLPMVLAIGIGVPGARGRWRVAVLHTVQLASISWLHAMVFAWTTGLTSPTYYLFPWSARVQRAWYNTLPTTISLYAAVLIGAWALAEVRERQRRTLRASQLEGQLTAARLETLQTKLQPHFLYNTLNGIAALVAALEPERAVQAIEQLSELLHASLRDDGREEIPVIDEIQLAERYLALQRLRFGERLRYELRVDPDARDCLVPVLLLQPIIENAVVHGLDAGLASLHVRVVAQRIGDSIVLRVENDGTSLATAKKESGRKGVGVAATRARLSTRYGESASLQLLERTEGGVVVRITVPAESARHEAHHEGDVSSAWVAAAS
jgi:sensor histidine kinase YesM